jgi:hypothetical protein
MTSKLHFPRIHCASFIVCDVNSEIGLVNQLWKKKLVNLLQSKQNHQLHIYVSNRMSEIYSEDNFERKSMRNLKFSLRRRFILLVFWVLMQYWLIKFRRNLLPPSSVSSSTLNTGYDPQHYTMLQSYLSIYLWLYSPFCWTLAAFSVS